ncbi:MFS transporter [Gottfriedia sp. NPDC057991]|uniref:MFS transporter n=1 Tax=Gottfriedia sp. NPDC057991 TaxID=3346298 RepID=UPI0036D88048
MSRSKEFLILLAILTGTILVPVNSTMIAVGLPTIASELSVSVSDITWVVTIYLIVMAVAQPIAGKLGDIYGNKKVLLIGFSLLIIFSVACAFSFNLVSLIIFRSLQALGGALVTPNATAIIRYVIPKDKISNVFGIFGMSMGLGAAVGPLLGSELISLFNWEAIFWVNIPFLLMAILLSWLMIPNLSKTKTNSLDIFGSIYLGSVLTFITLLLTHNEYLSVWTILILLLFIGLFIYQERTTQAPLIEFPMFKNRAFFSSNLSILINNFVMYSTILFIPILLKSYHFTINKIGSLLFYFSLAMSISALVGGKLANKFGKEKVIILSFLLSSFTVLFYFGFTPKVTYLYLMSTLLLGGFSAGIGAAAMQSTNIESVSKEKSGVAAGIYSTFRYMGGMMASAAVSIYVGKTFLYVLLLIVSVIGLILSIVLTLGQAKAVKKYLVG